MQVEIATSSVRRQAVAILCGLAALLRYTGFSHFYNGGVGEASRWTSLQQPRPAAGGI